MPAKPLAPTAGSRYIPPGVRQYYWVDTIEDKSSPTRTELDAGTDLTAEIGTVEGFQVASEAVDAPDLASRFTSKVPGMITAEDSAMNLYLSKEASSGGGQDARSLLVRDAAGFVVVFPEGDAEGKTLSVFPATIASAGVMPDLDAPAQLVVSFTITGEPSQNITVPSSA